ncbi:hypothetical protein ROZALSC1DRAFT_29868 [Rozella allomycis CSF55]|uniref:Uncharacterized protein n=1 Tax=Rozella allomycis (strain CSF55) TaxID=988480 RepID=A0A075B0K9_ROZAC|nr:hypothetical protein O9G_002072 [Rozella allomycis CSF55]RKP17220.1 hypothetical protein ROZALSC1DRAFT_30948 [Rozella allomycis CSF55]RKP18456.1 hypothetical protein ROZALSC1DRAFT_29868 [Rozella allomycis CSF55]|eukprot:EPZ34499.1 hypothetical protein O9G_002072 [Rozella allomycis CSF55]
MTNVENSEQYLQSVQLGTLLPNKAETPEQTWDASKAPFNKAENYLHQSMIMWRLEELRADIEHLENLLMMKQRHLTGLRQMTKFQNPQQSASVE